MSHRLIKRNARIVGLSAARKDLSLREIGDQFGITKGRVLQILNSQGIASHRGRCTLDLAKVDKAVTLYKRGMPVSHCAEAVGLNPSSLSHRLVREGVHKIDDSLRGRWTADDRRAAVEAVRSGAMSYQEAADAYGMTRNGVAGACFRAGVKKPTDWKQHARAVSNGQTLRWLWTTPDERKRFGRKVKAGHKRRRLAELQSGVHA